MIEPVATRPWQAMAGPGGSNWAIVVKWATSAPVFESYRVSASRDLCECLAESIGDLADETLSSSPREPTISAVRVIKEHPT
jgi:hypothetical protein